MSVVNDIFLRNSFIGMDGYRWFIAQVPPGQTPTSEGWGERVRVRIMGSDTGDGAILPDNELFYALISKSVESGYDNRQSSGIVGGETVIGFCLDGEEGQQPVITGVIDRCVDYSGATIPEALKNKSTNFKSIPPASFAKWRIGAAKLDPNVNFFNSNQGGTAEPTGKESASLRGDDNAQPGVSATAANEIDKLDEKTPGPDNCGNVVSRIQVELNRLTIILRGIKKYYQLYVVETANTIANLTDQLQTIINNIAGVIRTLVQRLRNFILRKLRNLLRDALDAILGDVLKDIKDSIIAKIFDALFCSFQDIINKLPLLIADFIAAIIGRFFAAPVCAAEQFINATLNNIIQDIDKAIKPIIGEINDILSGVLEIGGQIMDAIDQVLGVLGFLCINKECFDVKEFTASPWGGPVPAAVDDYQNFLKGISLKDISDDATEWLDGAGFSLSDDFTSPGQGVLGKSSCELVPEQCGPPQIQIFGGKGSNALASAVVNQAGQVIGAVLENKGLGYVRPPFVTFRDPCGYGRNAAGYGVIDAKFGVLQKIIITNPGYGYIDSPNGRTTFDPSEDTLNRPDPRETIQLPNGDSSKVDRGNGGNTTDPGDSDGSGIPGVVPGYPRDNDPTRFPTVPVVGCLDEVLVINTGIGYDQNDEIFISQEIDGLELTPRYTEAGQLVKLEVSGNVCGFTDIPDITINSATGVGVELRPVLTFTKATEFEEEDRKRIKEGILQVVQCISS
jgi:hypothetical protein